MLMAFVIRLNSNMPRMGEFGKLLTTLVKVINLFHSCKVFQREISSSLEIATPKVFHTLAST